VGHDRYDRPVRFVVCPARSLPPGSRRRVEVGGRGVAVFNVAGRYFAVRDICPHQGAPLSGGQVVHSVAADGPGCYRWDPASAFIRCPWHGWEYDLATGQSWSGPSRVRTFPVSIEAGGELACIPQLPPARRPGPYVAETIPVSLDGDHVVIDMESGRGGR